jgi:hypothetical protein
MLLVLTLSVLMLCDVCYGTADTRSIVQYHWGVFGWRQFLLELCEYLTFLVVIGSFCWIVKDEMDTRLYEVGCHSARPCYEWDSKALPRLSEMPLKILILGVWILVWSGLYLVGECINFMQIYLDEIGREKRLKWWVPAKPTKPKRAQVKPANSGEGCTTPIVAANARFGLLSSQERGAAATAGGGDAVPGAVARSPALLAPWIEKREGPVQHSERALATNGPSSGHSAAEEKLRAGEKRFKAGIQTMAETTGHSISVGAFVRTVSGLYAL